MIIQKELTRGFAGEEGLELGNIKWVHKKMENNDIYHEAKTRGIDFILINEVVRALKTKAASPRLPHKTNQLIGVYLQTIGIAAPRIEARFAVAEFSAKAKRSGGHSKLLRDKCHSHVQATGEPVGLFDASASNPGSFVAMEVGSMQNDCFTSSSNQAEDDGEKENSAPATATVAALPSRSKAAAAKENAKVFGQVQSDAHQ